MKSRAPDLWLLLPALVAAVLSAPGLGLGYIWDDFYFLTSHEAGSHLVPDPHATFYRPIPLGLYFPMLRNIAAGSPWLAHALNLTALLCVVTLLTLLASKLRGRRAGLVAGLWFACYGQLPTLVSWVSASQDLFAMLFLIAAFYLRHRGWCLPALVAATAALLCKETALAAFPVLVLWDHLLGRPARSPILQWVGYSLVFVLWAIVHPGIHHLAQGRASAIGYVGVQGAAWALRLGRYLMTLLNLPPWGVSAAWPENRAAYGFAALIVLLAGLYVWDRRRRGSAGETFSLARIARWSALLVIPSLVIPAVLVGYAAPHLTAVAAMGFSVFAGSALATRGKLLTGALLAVFLLLGIASRGAKVLGEEWIATETAMIEASDAARDVRANFQRVLPDLPKESQVVLSMGRIGQGVQMALVDGQALRLWYRDPTLNSVMIRDRRPGAPSERFVRVINGLDVIAIDADSLRIHSAYGAELDLNELDHPVKNYARAVAAGGDTDRAIRIVEQLDRIETGDLNLFNARLIASMLFAAGRRAEADSVLRRTASFPHEMALQAVTMLQADASPSEGLDESAFEAFGLSSKDPAAIRWLMLDLRKNGFMPQSAWFALKLKALAPGDPEAEDVLAAAKRMKIEPRRVPGREGRLAL